MIQRDLPVVTLGAVLRPRWQDVAVRNNTHKTGEVFPGHRGKQPISVYCPQKPFNFGNWALPDLDSSGRDEAPQTHKAIHRGIHRQEIDVHNGGENLANVRTCSPAEERGLRVTEILLGESRLPLKDGSNSHSPQVRLSD